MLIISKRRDYYDYLVNIYGVDNNLVFNRREDIISDEIGFSQFGEERNTYDIYICNRIYRVQQIKNGVWELHKFHKTNTNYYGFRRSELFSEVGDDYRYEDYMEVDKNKLGDSVLKIVATYRKGRNLGGRIPILSTFGIPSVLEPERLYMEIELRLGQLLSKREVVSHQTDKDKATSKGFDSKISFRHRK